MRIWRSEYFWRFLNAGLIVAALVAGAAGLHVLGVSDAIDRKLWETRFALDTKPVTGRIVLVDIDAQSLNELGVWPLPRRIHGDVTGILAEAGAEDIVFDIDFSTRSNPVDDRLFAEAIEEVGNVSLAMFAQSGSAEAGADVVVNRPLEMFLDAAWPVVVMVPLEADGWVWRNLYGKTVGGLTELSASAYLGEFSGTAAGAFWIDYGIEANTFVRVSFADVLKQRVDLSVFEGRKVIIGASALELRDLFSVPVHGVLPGSAIQALGAESILQGRSLYEWGEGEALFAVLAVIVLLLVTRAGGLAVKTGIAVLLSAALEITGFMFYKNVGVLMPTACAQSVLLAGGGFVVLRELGFQRLLSHMAIAGRRNSERMLSHVFDDSFNAIVVVRADGQITAASRMARTLFSNDVAAGRSAGEVLPEALSGEVIALASEASAGPVGPKVLGIREADGTLRHLEYVITRSEKVLTRANGRRGVEPQALACLTCRDVTEERRYAERLEYLARFNPLTGLLNRHGFEEELERRVDAAHGKGQGLCLIQFAITNLDQIIASLGYSYGDEIRMAVAQRLECGIAEDVKWAAISGIAFAGILEDPRDTDWLSGLIGRIETVVGEDYSIGGARISVHIKLGYVLCEGRMSAPDLMRNAGNALAKVRRDPQLSSLMFKPELEDALQRRRKLETELFQAIVRDELEVCYQPLVHLHDQSVFGAEALLRWRHGELGPVSPAEFIPIAEENGFIVDLGAWVMNRAMREAMTWSEPLKLSVNLSPVQFARGDVAATVQDALHRTGFPANRLDLEITESLFIDEGLGLKGRMEKISSIGCSFSLDDFGTGYSSLGYIGQYPFSKIKLDRSFVSETLTGPKEVAIIEAVVHIAKGNGMKVLVEGVEALAQAHRLAELGCDFGQGYFFGKPMTLAEFSERLKMPA